MHLKLMEVVCKWQFGPCMQFSQSVLIYVLVCPSVGQCFALCVIVFVFVCCRGPWQKHRTWCPAWFQVLLNV